MASMAPPYNDTYTFQSEPRALRTRPKYRAQDAAAPPGSATMYGNLMHDPRIVRGSTLKPMNVRSGAQADPVAVQKQQEKRRLQQARARAKAKMKPRDVEPVAGRAHIEVQTELYLEELTDRVEESDISVQTDPFLDRPPSPLFIPAKTGVDAETQIEDGELFDFDLESKPILEVLVGKTMEQSLLEVMEEEELDALRDHQAEFEELRNAELMETQRLEEQARRRREERERRLLQQAEVARQEAATTKKIAARSFAQSYLSGLVPSVFDNLDANGYFYDAQEREIEEVFLPWLLDGVEEGLVKQQRGRELLDAILLDVVTKRSAAYNPTPAEAATPADSDDVGEASAGPAEPEAAKNDGDGGDGGDGGSSDAADEASTDNADTDANAPIATDEAGPDDTAETPPGDNPPEEASGSDEKPPEEDAQVEAESEATPEVKPEEAVPEEAPVAE